MKNYYLYLDPDDGILYVLKDGEIIAPVKTSASFDPKTIRIKDGYLQIRDFETNNWKFICDEDGLPVSLKGPAGDRAVLDVTKDSFSVLIGLDSETDGNLQFTTYLNYYLNSNQEVIDCEENIEVECSDKITVYLQNYTPLTVEITIVIPDSISLTDIENAIKFKTVGLPFACASIHLLPIHLPKEECESIDPEVIDGLLNEVNLNAEKLDNLTAELDYYQKSTDRDLRTSNQTIVGAINELYLNQLMGGTSIEGSYTQTLNLLVYRDLDLLPGLYTISGTITCSVIENEPYNSACIYVAQTAPHTPIDITEDSTVYDLGEKITVEDGYKAYLVFAYKGYILSLHDSNDDLFLESPFACTITVSNLEVKQVISTMGLRDTIVNYMPVPVESAKYISANTVLTKKALLARQEFSLDYVQLEQNLDQESLKELYEEILLNPNKNIAPDCQFIKIENVDGVINPTLPKLLALYDSGVNNSSLDSLYRYISENNRVCIYITDMDYITTEAQWVSV